MWTTLYASILFAAAHASSVANIDPPQNPIFPLDARLELVFTRTAKLNSGLAEGPAVAPDGSVYFTDMPFGPAEQTMIHRYDPRSGGTRVFTASAGKSNGLAFDARGNLLACEGADGGGRCVGRWNLATGKKQVLADRFGGRRLNSPNDLCVDRRGNIYFTDPRYSGSEPRELEQQAVYRVDATGTVTLVTRDVEMPNGIVLSPDERTLYVGDHNNGGNRLRATDPPPRRGVMRLYAFPLDAAGQVAGARRTLVDFGAENGCDGITVDEAGHVYAACRSLTRPGVLVIDPQGKRLAMLQTGPSNQSGLFDRWRGIPSNVEFGAGDDRHTLYVTIDKSLRRIRTQQQGAPPVWADSRRGQHNLKAQP